MRWLGVLAVACACGGATKKTTTAKPGRPCPDGLEEKLHALWSEIPEGEEGSFEVTRIRVCREGRFGSPGWALIATYGQPEDSQAEIGWSHHLVVVGEDGAVRAKSDIGGSGWMDGPWGGELQLADFDGDGVDELIYTDSEFVDPDGYDPMNPVEVVSIHRVAGAATEEKLRLRVKLQSVEPMHLPDEEKAQTPIFTCASTWQIVDGPGGTRRLEVTTSTEWKDPRPADEQPEEDPEEEPRWKQYRCPEPGKHVWALTNGVFSEIR
jgi:hypothetical protein